MEKQERIETENLNQGFNIERTETSRTRKNRTLEKIIGQEKRQKNKKTQLEQCVCEFIP